MNGPRITYNPLPDATRQSELSAIVAIYKFALEAHAKKKAAMPSGPENGVKEDQHVHTKGSIRR